jgi:hypothetical protein
MTQDDPDRVARPSGSAYDIPPDQLAAARFLLAMREDDSAEMWRVLMSTSTLPLLCSRSRSVRVTTGTSGSTGSSA